MKKFLFTFSLFFLFFGSQAQLSESRQDASFRISQNYPNPARDITHIRLQLNAGGYVSLKLYDMLGNSVSIITEQYLPAGTYSLPVETHSLPDGVYFYTIKKEGESETLKMVISKER
jgi:hypothetical protein